MKINLGQAFRFMDSGVCPYCYGKLEELATCKICPNESGKCKVSFLYDKNDDYIHVGHARYYRDGRRYTDVEVELDIMEKIEDDFILRGLTDEFDWIRDIKDEMLSMVKSRS